MGVVKDQQLCQYTRISSIKMSCSVALYGSRMDRTDDTFVLGNYLFIDYNKNIQPFCTSILCFSLHNWMTLTQLPLCHTTWISTMRKTCHKNNKRGKKILTLFNEIYWRKITYLYIGLSTKISIYLFQLYLTVFESSFS